MDKFPKIVHLTSAHPRYDIRIFRKMATSLSEAGFDTFLIVADGKGDEKKGGVTILDVGVRNGGRISRMTKTVSKVYSRAISLDADIYHLHDPELMPIGLKLKKKGKKVIFDAHEDLPKQLLTKPYLNRLTRVVLSKVFSIYEGLVCKKFDAIITATPVIRDKFLKINKNSYDINNFPLINELNSSTDWDEKASEVAYVGGYSEIRGIKQIVKAMAHTQNIKLNLAGACSEKDVKVEVSQYAGWKNVDDYGQVSRSKVKEILAQSRVGIVTFLAAPNHVESQPNKMFEYMSAGIPVLGSNFNLWKEIIVNNDCGICVDPESPKEIAEGISRLVQDSNLSRKMGENGRKAVMEKYNWEKEAEKLLTLYEGILN